MTNQHWSTKPMTNNNDKQMNSDAEEELIFFCYFCGAPEPCRKNACIQAAFAQADYWEKKGAN
jgi:hypothetical protein